VPSIDEPESASASSPATSPNTNSSPAASEEHSATPPLRRLTRNRKPNPLYADYNTSCIFALLIEDPIFLKKLGRSPSGAKPWKRSC